MQLRDYQTGAVEQVKQILQQPDAHPVIVVATGGGKSVMCGHLAHHYNATYYQAAIAHRRELVSQLALSLARHGVEHRIVGPEVTVQECRRAQLEDLGYHKINQSARMGVCSVDTLVARDLSKDTWARSVAVAHLDEHHHTLRENKWGKALKSFPALRNTIGYTATPRRADRRGLGRHSDGISTHLVEGPPMSRLIDEGYLTPYKLVMRQVTDVDISRVATAAGGDYNPQAMRKTIKQSRQLVGNAVALYQHYTPGKKAVLFAADVEHACTFRDSFLAAGISAEIVTADTKEEVRRATMRRFRSGEIKVLLNVDLFGEGFDLPAIEAVIMCRPTKSLPLFHQQFGRGLRLMVSRDLLKNWHEFTPEQRKAHIAASEKPHAWIFDLVANTLEPACGGLPDARGRVWSLDGAERGRSGPPDVPPVRACTNPEPVDASGMLCTGVYERFLTACPFCGYAPVPAGRTIEQVDGDVVLLDEETLRQLRGEYLTAHTTPSYGGPHAAALYARHRERHAALTDLQRAIEWWGPCYEIEQGRKLTDREQQKAFFLVFGITTLEALALKRADAEALKKKVLDWMELKGFTIPA